MNGHHSVFEILHLTLRMSYNILECIVDRRLLYSSNLRDSLSSRTFYRKCAVPDVNLAVESELEKIENSQNGKVKNRTSTQLSIVLHSGRVFA